MRRSLIVIGAMASAVLATVALAQPRGARPPRGAPASASVGSASAAPTGAAGGGAATTASLPGAPLANSPSQPPPAPPDVGDGGAKLSPLNPASNEFSDASATTSPDYDRLLADVASLRARAAAVSDTLFHSRLAISLETSGDHGRIASLSVSVDDGAVWNSPAAFRAEDQTAVYDHAVAPGHHAVTVDVERRDDRDDTFRSSQRSRFIVDVPADGRLALDIKLWDDSNMGGDFPSDKKGKYELRVRAEARAQPAASGK